MSQRIRKAVFPVAGLGTRFLPITKTFPKEMLPLIDKPLIQYSVEEALASGIEQLIFITGRGQSAIENYFDYAPELNYMLKSKGCMKELEIVNASVFEPGTITYLRQQFPLGLGHAIWCARHLIGDEPFAVLLPDDFIQSEKPCLQQMIEVYQDHQNSLLAVMEVPIAETQHYGILDVKSKENNRIYAKGLVEKPLPNKAPSCYAVVGRYILTPDIFEKLDKQEKGQNNEIQLTDAIAKTIKGNSLCGLLFEGERYDCGNKKGMLDAIISLALKREDLKVEVQKFFLKDSRHVYGNY